MEITNEAVEAAAMSLYLSAKILSDDDSPVAVWNNAPEWARSYHMEDARNALKAAGPFLSS